MADQSVSAILLAWSEPFVVGAAGLRGPQSLPVGSGQFSMEVGMNMMDAALKVDQ